MRLTERKVCYPECDKQGNLTKVDYIEIKDKKLAEQKLCQLEDIEDELGISLVILFNALRNGVYYRMYSGQITKDYVFLISNNMSIGQVSKLDYYFMTCFEKSTLLFGDYGKSWALTEEELL